MSEVDLHTFAAAHASGAIVIDVREPLEYVGGHVPGARLVPMARLAQVAAELPRTEPVYVICASGARSLVAVGVLGHTGIKAYSVAGGTGAWTRAGRSVVYGAHER